jgi:hypothetical protein
MTNACPFCARPVPPVQGRPDCPHCGKLIFSVPCPSCHRPTLNLTQLARYGHLTCFMCKNVFDRLPGGEAPAPLPATPAPAALRPAARAPKTPGMPTAAEARAALESNLTGLERAAQDRELLMAPDLRAIVTRFLDNLHDAMILDDLMTGQKVHEAWLRDPEHLGRVERACFAPLWPQEGALLPPATQAWVLAVDDAARRWQYARRRWCEERCGLVMMPVVPGVTTTNGAWHVMLTPGSVVTAVASPGFLLHGEVLRKAHVHG